MVRAGDHDIDGDDTGQYVVDDVSTSKLSFMFGVLAATAFIMGVWYVWAAKREQRFRRQLDGLKIMRSGQY